MVRFTLFIFISILTLSSVAQSNGIVIEAEYKATAKCSSDSTRDFITYYIRKDILRIDLQGSNANSSIIFQPSSQKVWVMYHHEMVYYSMTYDEVKLIEETVMKKADEFARSLSQLDSASRKETMMIWPDGNPFIFEDPEYKLVDKKDSLVSQLLCDKYMGKTKSGNTKYFYSNSLKTTGIKDDELAILNQLSEFMGKGVKAMSGSMDFANIYKKGKAGYPILQENYNGTQLCNAYLMKFIYRNHLPNHMFEIPVSYGKVDNPLGNR